MYRLRVWAEVAEDIARKAHKGQTDKGGNDYILHPMFVASRMDTDAEKAVAWLHDVVEDTPVTLDDLREIFPEEIVEAVDAITKRLLESYSEYLCRVASNDIAYKVKLADMENNSDISRISNPSAVDIERCERYILRKRQLISAYRRR